MKTKIFRILAVIALLLVSFTTAETEKTGKNGVKTCEISFSAPEILGNGKYVNVNLEETNSIMRYAGNPMLPFYSKTMTFPLGTKIKSLECTCSQVKTMSVDKKIQPAPKPLPINIKKKAEVTMDNEIYGSMDPYPNVWLAYRTSGGLDRAGNHVIFLTIYFYPVRYLPGLNTLQYVENIETRITYEEASQPLIYNDEYDLVIVSYDKYASLLEPLVSHKESHNIYVQNLSRLMISTTAFISQYMVGIILKKSNISLKMH